MKNRGFIHNFNTFRALVFVLLTITLICVFSGAPAAAVSVSDFGDISSNSWYYDSVSYVVSKGLFNGTSATEFSPNGTMTRAMFITVLGRYAGVNAADWTGGSVSGSGVNLRSGPGTSYASKGTYSNGTRLTITGKSGDWYAVTIGSKTGYIYSPYVKPDYHEFSDISYSAYYAGYAIWAYEKGYISGYGSSSVLSPNTAITREQICKIFYSYAQKNGLTIPDNSSVTSFADDADISSWAVTEVAAMRKSGVINGVQDGSVTRFEPKRSAKRSEVAAMFCRFASLIGGSGTQTDTPTATPATTPTADPGEPQRAEINGNISLYITRVKAGLYVSTAQTDTSVDSVVLSNTGGGGFEYGSFDSSRNFISQGTLNYSELTIYAEDYGFDVYVKDGAYLYTGGDGFGLRPIGGGPVCVDGQYRYRGDFQFSVAANHSGHLTLVNVVDIEDYVKGVVPYEFSNSWPAETLKAAAVACRSFIQNYAKTSVYTKYGFDIIANNGAMTYLGRGVSYSDGWFSASDAAVDATSGQYLTCDGEICYSCYHSSDGGATEDNAHINGASISYLTGKIDPYEARAVSDGKISSYTYSNTCSRTGSAMNSLASSLGLSTIARDGIKVNTYAATGNVESVTITDVNGRSATVGRNTSLTRWGLMSKFGFTWYSYRYTVSYDSSSDSFTMTRYGWGHNVVMSQWGAYSMAYYYGYTYQDILGFYYTGTTIKYGV